MNNKAVRKYLRDVNRKLCCRKGTRKRLLDGFREELAESDLGDMNYEQLVLQFGKPEELAQSLMEAVDPAEIARESKRKMARPYYIAGMIALILVLIFAAYVWYVSVRAIDYAVDTITITEYSESTE